MYVTTVRGHRYENILIHKFNGRKFFDTKISQITVHRSENDVAIYVHLTHFFTGYQVAAGSYSQEVEGGTRRGGAD